jgi:hypothetical protein
MNPNKIFASVVLILMVTACASPIKIVEVPKEIKLRVVMPGPQLIVDEPPTKGCQGVSDVRKKGCIVAAKGEQVSVDFRLLQPGYHIAKFEVCPGTDKRSDTSVHCNLPGLKRSEFILNFAGKTAIPDQHGIVDFRAIAPGADVEEFNLLDKNTIKANYFYRIQACTDPDDPAVPGYPGETGCFWTDPPIQNTGVGTIP